MMLIAALMLAQAPVAGAAAEPVAKKKKPEQVCQYIEVTGSHQRQRVCQDAPAAGQDMDFGTAPAGLIRALPSGAAPGGFGTPPK